MQSFVNDGSFFSGITGELAIIPSPMHAVKSERQSCGRDDSDGVKGGLTLTTEKGFRVQDELERLTGVTSVWVLGEVGINIGSVGTSAPHNCQSVSLNHMKAKDIFKAFEAGRTRVVPCSSLGKHWWNLQRLAQQSRIVV